MGSTSRNFPAVLVLTFWIVAGAAPAAMNWSVTFLLAGQCVPVMVRFWPCLTVLGESLRVGAVAAAVGAAASASAASVAPASRVGDMLPIIPPAAGRR